MLLLWETLSLVIWLDASLLRGAMPWGLQCLSARSVPKSTRGETLRPQYSQRPRRASTRGPERCSKLSRQEKIGKQICAAQNTVRERCAAVQ